MRKCYEFLFRLSYPIAITGYYNPNNFLGGFFMFPKKYKSSGKRKGFTLVELLVVIAILAILIAIVVVNFANVRTNAAIATHNANVRSLKAVVILAIAEGHTPVNATKIIKTGATGDFQTAMANHLNEDPDYDSVKWMLSDVPRVGATTDGYYVRIDSGEEWRIFPGEVERKADGTIGFK